MNLPNYLTLSRLLLIPFFLFFIGRETFFSRGMAFSIFILASFSDWLDGYLARRQRSVTTLGIFLDPLADKLLISTVLISFVALTELRIPVWMVIVIISREFIITGLRMIAATKGKVIPAERAGKFKTTSQIVAINLILLLLVLQSIPSLLPSWIMNTPYWLMLLAMVLTLISGISYIWRYRDLLT